MPVNISKDKMRDIGDQILEDATMNLSLQGVTKFKWDQRIDHKKNKVTIIVEITEMKKVE